MRLIAVRSLGSSCSWCVDLAMIIIVAVKLLRERGFDLDHARFLREPRRPAALAGGDIARERRWLRCREMRRLHEVAPLTPASADWPAREEEINAPIVWFLSLRTGPRCDPHQSRAGGDRAARMPVRLLPPAWRKDIRGSGRRSQYIRHGAFDALQVWPGDGGLPAMLALRGLC